jgi:hypothetical protein
LFEPIFGLSRLKPRRTSRVLGHTDVGEEERTVRFKGGRGDMRRVVGCVSRRAFFILNREDDSAIN